MSRGVHVVHAHDLLGTMNKARGHPCGPSSCWYQNILYVNFLLYIFGMVDRRRRKKTCTGFFKNSTLRLVTSYFWVKASMVSVPGGVQDVRPALGHPMVFTDLKPTVVGARCSPDGGWHQPGGVTVPSRSARRPPLRSEHNHLRVNRLAAACLPRLT